MKPRNRLTSLLLLGALAMLAGCDRNDAIPFTAEDAEPQFEKGRQLSRQGRDAEALASYLKVIDKRGNDAPESHLAVGLIYQQHLNDHISAIYHFKKYLELQPNSKLATQVRQRIDTSIKEFARTLPGRPLDTTNLRLASATQEDVDRLQKENEQLHAEIKALRAGVSGVPITSPTAYRPSFDIQGTPQQSKATPVMNDGDASLGEESGPFVKAPESADGDQPETGGIGLTIPDTNPKPAQADQASGNPASAASSRQDVASSTPAAKSQPAVAKAQPNAPKAEPTKPQAATGKRHTVQAKETLSSIALKYYGTRAKAKDIYQANRDQLKSEKDTLRLGMELKIP